MYVKESNCQVEMNAFLGTFQGFSSQWVKQLCYIIAFLQNTSQLLLETFELIVARALQS